MTSSLPGLTLPAPDEFGRRSVPDAGSHGNDGTNSNGGNGGGGGGGGGGDGGGSGGSGRMSPESSTAGEGTAYITA